MITSFSISPGLSLFSLHCEGDCARKGNNTIYNTLTVSQTAVSGLGSAVVAAPIFFNSSLIAQHCWRWRFSCWLGATRVGRQTGVGTREPAGHNREISHLISVEERTVNYCQCNPQGDDQWAMWELVSCLFVKIVRTTNLTTNREKWSETQMATF